MLVQVAVASAAPKYIALPLSQPASDPAAYQEDIWIYQLLNTSEALFAINRIVPFEDNTAPQRGYSLGGVGGGPAREVLPVVTRSRDLVVAVSAISELLILRFDEGVRVLNQSGQVALPTGGLHLNSGPIGMNARRDVTATAIDDSTGLQTAYFISGGTATPLAPGVQAGYPYVSGTLWPQFVSDDGVVVGSRIGEQGVNQAFVWSSGALTTLPTPAGAGETVAIRTATNGDIYGVSFVGENVFVPVRWRDGIVQTLELPDGFDGAGTITLNSAGDFLLYVSRPGASYQAIPFVNLSGTYYDGRTLADSPDGTSFIGLVGPNDLGEFVGQTTAGGLFLLRPIPEPAGVGVVVLASAVAVLRRRRLK